MTERDDERELRRRFERLRAEDARRAPAFGAMLREAERRAREEAEGDAEGGSEATVVRLRRRPVRWVAAASVAAAAAAVAYFGVPDPDREFERVVAAYSEEISGTSWRSPTDALLDVPGRGLLGGVPTIGGGPAWPGSLTDIEGGRNDG